MKYLKATDVTINSKMYTCGYCPPDSMVSHYFSLQMTHNRNIQPT